MSLTQLFLISQSKRILPLFPPEAYHCSLAFYVFDWMIDWEEQEAGKWLTEELSEHEEKDFELMQDI